MQNWFKHKSAYFVLGAVILAISFGIRIISYPVISGDYTASLSHWMDALRGSPGLSAFKMPFSDYAPLYLYLLKLLTLTGVYDLFAIKTLSFIFDVAIAALGAAMVKRTRGQSLSTSQTFLIFAVMLSIPTVVLNSSMWAQSDALYAFFILTSLYAMMRNRPFGAAVLFGIAISLKLQAIFFLPVLAGWLLGRRHGWALFMIPAVFLVSILPAWLAGGSLINLLSIYIQQGAEFQELSLSAPSVFAFLQEKSLSPVAVSLISYAGILLAFIAASYLAMRTATSARTDDLSPSRFTLLSLASVLVIPFLLPHMHERYFYIADIISVLYAFYEPRRWYIPVAVVLASFFSYMPFLSGSVPVLGRLVMSEAIWAPVLLAVSVHIAYMLFGKKRTGAVSA